VTLKICFLSPEYTGFGGGIGTFYRNLAPALVRAGAEVTVVEGSCFANSAIPSRTSVDGVVIQKLETARVCAWLDKLNHLSALPSLSRHLAAAWASWEQAQENGPFDVIEATDFGLLMVPPLLAGNKPVIAQMHGSIGQIQSKDPAIGEEIAGALSLAIESEVASLVASCQTYSKANRDYWNRASGSHAVELLPPAWIGSGSQSQPATIRPVISVFGRIQMWKGPKILSEALTLLPDCPVVHWYGRDIANSETGIGSTKDQLLKMYPAIWQGRVVTHAPVPPETVQTLQASSQVNLVPSTWDVFNFTVIEALASGRPVVCSDRAGAAELIDDGVNGFIYDGTCPQALAAALRRALELSAEQSTTMGSAAQKTVASLLDPELIAKRRIESYKRAIDRKQSGGEVPDWLSQVARPRQPGPEKYFFLNNLPLQPLLKHIGRRFVRKLKGK
jgi:glycosyltransferase involved in cell wall biosynthesis